MCVLILVDGQVQGVGYRAFARSAARKLGVHGHARNLADGRVEVLACGAAQALQEFTARLREGPRWARVDGLTIRESSCPEPDGFSTG